MLIFELHFYPPSCAGIWNSAPDFDLIIPSPAATFTTCLRPHTLPNDEYSDTSLPFMYVGWTAFKLLSPQSASLCKTQAPSSSPATEVEQGFRRDSPEVQSFGMASALVCAGQSPFSSRGAYVGYGGAATATSPSWQRESAEEQSSRSHTRSSRSPRRRSDLCLCSSIDISTSAPSEIETEAAYNADGSYASGFRV
ncbi:hypothetical protein DFH08DRAFT_821652 [Mycena albidolilacea]|uniref:Uncharacterized protein n=1 Tax=Mycena albidolilacea TaxID=1033008 RepID=A0AAD6ZB56_9AGAR|nr:hypothetical protein DFH08DRAFT_821652 [Mycena albidolilacea]